MPITQYDLDEARDRVRECELAIADQFQLILELRAGGKHMAGAEDVLQALNLALQNLCESRDRIAIARGDG